MEGRNRRQSRPGILTAACRAAESRSAILPAHAISRSNNIYYPGQEQFGPDEMRISFIGSTPIPVTRAQAGTCIMVELGTATGSSLISVRLHA